MELRSDTALAKCVVAIKAVVVFENSVIDDLAKVSAHRAACGCANKATYDCAKNAANSDSNGACNYPGSSSNFCAAHNSCYARRSSSSGANGATCFFAIVSSFNTPRLAYRALWWG